MKHLPAPSYQLTLLHFFCFPSLSTSHSCFAKLNWKNSRRSATSGASERLQQSSDAEFPEIKFILMRCFAFSATGHSERTLRPCQPDDTAAGFLPNRPCSLARFLRGPGRVLKACVEQPVPGATQHKAAFFPCAVLSIDHTVYSFQFP